MKILLLSDVPRVGNKGQIIDVAQAYAMNSFVNKKLARIATVADEKNIKIKEDIRKEKKEIEQDKFFKTFTTLEKDVFTFVKKVDDKGHLYAKLSTLEMTDAIYEKGKLSISEKQISMPDIHELGDYEAVVTVNAKKYTLKIKVVK
jgi:large subunit ribosomal protein L9